MKSWQYHFRGVRVFRAFTWFLLCGLAIFGAKVSAGLFTVGPEGSIARRSARVDRPGEVTAFAVSIEPAAGSSAPTGPIVLVGTIAG